jgi:tetratricopeptide (TPR) repeat protein
MRRAILLFAVALWLVGCAAKNAAPPPKRIVQSPESGLNDLDLVVRAIPPVGGVLPVQIAVTNVTTRSLSLDAQGIRADTASGASAGTLSPDQAIEAAGGAQKLAEALSRVYLVHVAGHQKEPGRAAFAAQMCLLPVTQPGMAAGYPPGTLGAAWIFFVCPIIVGGTMAKSLAVASSPSMQVSDVALSSGGLSSGMETSGYIFLPTGTYKALELPVKDTSTGGIETIVHPWDSATDLASTTVVQCDKAGMQMAISQGGEQFAAKDFTRALGYYQEALTACPSSAQAHLNVARAYEALGDRDMAMDYYRRAIQFAPSDDAAVREQARQALARLSAK